MDVDRFNLMTSSRSYFACIILIAIAALSEYIGTFESYLLVQSNSTLFVMREAVY